MLLLQHLVGLALAASTVARGVITGTTVNGQANANGLVHVHGSSGGARDNYFVNFSLTISTDLPNGTIFTLDRANTMLISSRVNGNENCGEHVRVDYVPAEKLVVAPPGHRQPTVAYSIDKITLTPVKNSHPQQWRNCLLTSYLA
jgi:hypothetical protein